MTNNLVEAAVTVCLIVLALLVLNPFHFWMPDMVVLCILAFILGFFAVLASFVLRESMVDERDTQHRAFAGRNAFLAGAAVLTVGIVAQGYTHTVDPWLVVALVTMVLVKLGTRIWSDTHR